LLAARRIAADPYATFRSVSIVALAAVALTYTGSSVALHVPPEGSGAARLRPGVVSVNTGGVPAEQVAPVLEDDSVVAVYGGGAVFVPCLDLARVRYHVTCPHGPVEESGMLEPGPVGPGQFIIELYVPTDGSLAAENRVRTAVANLVPNAIINSDRDPVDYGLETFFFDFDRLGRVAALFVLIVGAFGLAAAMIGGLLERRRPFALLHASGVRVGQLRRAVLLETTATMLLTSVAGAAVGLILAFSASRQATVDWRWPGADAIGAVAGGVVAALVFSTLALPLLSRTIRHDGIRYE
jgi:hypothetical protein